MNTAPLYVMGHADLEIERLQLQASIIAGVTRRLIQECGIRPGMRVLDLGCGAGRWSKRSRHSPPSNLLYLVLPGSNLKAMS
jgi:hypothetical protein